MKQSASNYICLAHRPLGTVGKDKLPCNSTLSPIRDVNAVQDGLENAECRCEIELIISSSLCMLHDPPFLKPNMKELESRPVKVVL